MNRHQIFFLTVLTGLSLVLNHCRSRPQAAKDGEQTVDIAISLKNIDEVDRNKTLGLIAEMSCNGSATFTSGSFSDFARNEVSFAMQNVKQGDPCNVRLTNPSPAEELVFLRTDRVVYETPSTFAIGVRTGGELWAQAQLTRVYKLKPGKTSLEVPVKFPKSYEGDLSKLTAELKCNPEFEGVAIGLKQAKEKNTMGVFSFDSGVKPGVSYACEQIQVSNGSSDAKFYGEMNEQPIADKGESLIAVKQVELVEIEISSVSGVVIVTTPGEACKENEVYDLSTRKCVKAP